VLHELAHLLCPPEVGHGPRFADVLLTLVRHEMGFNAYADLHAALARSPAFASVAGT
jgi:predicted metal-dependent hydrolase